jgi:class I fructose-bisphosphate aldolase
LTIYPGSGERKEMYENLRAYAEEAKERSGRTSCGAIRRAASSPRRRDGRGRGGYAAQIACQMGAHVVKVKLPTDHIEQDAAKKVYEKRRFRSGR